MSKRIKSFLPKVSERTLWKMLGDNYEFYKPWYFNRKENFIRAFGNGRYLEDSIDKFKKIQISTEEQKVIRKTKTCGGCKGRG